MTRADGRWRPHRGRAGRGRRARRGAGRPPRARGPRVSSTSTTWASPTTPTRSALNNVTLHVPAGQHVSVIGRSGAGKSTLAALLARFHDPTAGGVLIDGRDVRNCARDWVRAQVGLVLPDTVMFAGTVADNIAYGTDASACRRSRSAAHQRRRPHVRRPAPRRLRHRARPGRRRAVGRPAPAHRHRPHAPARPADRPARRAHRGAGPGERRPRCSPASTRSCAAAPSCCSRTRWTWRASAERVVVMVKGEVVDDGQPREVLDRPVPFAPLGARPGARTRRRRAGRPRRRTPRCRAWPSCWIPR